MACRRETIGAHTTVVILFISGLTSGTETNDDIARTDVGIVDDIAALHSTGNGAVHYDGAHQIAHVGCLATGWPDADAHLTVFGEQLIGTLKALGADNRFVRRIFLTQAALLIGKGMLYGNALGFILASIQYKYHLVPLDAATYYVDFVPIAFPWGWLLVLNILTLTVSMLILLLPSMIITKISPAKVMHFE